MPKLHPDFPSENAELFIWDTLGQEKFQSLAKIYFNGTVGAFLVFDITSRKSFEAIGTKWYPMIRDSCNNNVILTLLGNKRDTNCEDWEVEYNEAMTFARKNQMNYFEVSAKSTKNIIIAFHLLA